MTFKHLPAGLAARAAKRADNLSMRCGTTNRLLEALDRATERGFAEYTGLRDRVGSESWFLWRTWCHDQAHPAGLVYWTRTRARITVEPPQEWCLPEPARLEVSRMMHGITPRGKAWIAWPSGVHGMRVDHENATVAVCMLRDLVAERMQPRVDDTARHRLRIPVPSHGQVELSGQAGCGE